MKHVKAEIGEVLSGTKKEENMMRRSLFLNH
jgi:hypothetical protein